mmetsp:Transcript_16280/g.35421  ORF Transcript_16280/g.35421 Transcript_16280/m.35421 type:complete len:306 (-) Transcript_16280:164-1081(-)
MRHVGRVGGGGHGVGGGRLAVVRHRLRIVGRRVLQLVALAAVQALREEEVDVEQVQQGKDERCHEDAVLPEGMDVGGLRSEVGFVSTARRIDFRLVRRVALVVIVCVKHSRPTPPPMPVPLVVDVGQITAQKRPDGEAESESGQRESEGRHPSVAVFDHVGYVSKSQRERRGEQSGECEQRHEHIYAMKGGDEVHRKTDAFGTEGGVPAPFGGLSRVYAIQKHASPLISSMIDLVPTITPFSRKKLSPVTYSPSIFQHASEDTGASVPITIISRYAVSSPTLHSAFQTAEIQRRTACPECTWQCR